MKLACISSYTVEGLLCNYIFQRLFYHMNEWISSKKVTKALKKLGQYRIHTTKKQPLSYYLREIKEHYHYFFLGNCPSLSFLEQARENNTIYVFNSLLAKNIEGVNVIDYGYKSSCMNLWQWLNIPYKDQPEYVIDFDIFRAIEGLYNRNISEDLFNLYCNAEKWLWAKKEGKLPSFLITQVAAPNAHKNRKKSAKGAREWLQGFVDKALDLAIDIGDFKIILGFKPDLYLYNTIPEGNYIFIYRKKSWFRIYFVFTDLENDVKEKISRFVDITQVEGDGCFFVYPTKEIPDSIWQYITPKHLEKLTYPTYYNKVI